METLTSAFVDATSSIPGYGVIAQILLQSYGVDAGKLASKYIIIFAICKAVIWLWDKIYDFLQYVRHLRRLSPEILTLQTETTSPPSSRSTTTIACGTS
jgi:hypothetical protein